MTLKPSAITRLLLATLFWGGATGIYAAPAAAQSINISAPASKIVLAQQTLRSLDFEALFKVAITRAIMDSDHFTDMDRQKRQRFSILAQEELATSWPDIEMALATDLAKPYSPEQMTDISAFAETAIVHKIMRAVLFGEPMPTKGSLSDQDIADLDKIKDRPYLRDLLSNGINPYMVQDRIEAVMFRALDRLNKETVF